MNSMVNLLAVPIDHRSRLQTLFFVPKGAERHLLARLIATTFLISTVCAMASVPAHADTIQVIQGDSYPTGVSANGSVVSLILGAPFAYTNPGVWTQAGSGQLLTPVGLGGAYGVSQDGTTIVGTSTAIGAAYWVNGGNGQTLPLPANAYDPYYVGAVSGNGSVILGTALAFDALGGENANTEAVRWTTGTPQVLSSPYAGATHTYSIGVSADGNTAVGFGDQNLTVNGSQFDFTYRPIIWNAGSTVGAPLPDNNVGGATESISADGKTIVGFLGNASMQAAIWQSDAQNPQTWHVHGLGFLPGGNQSQALAANADGSMVVGYGNTANGQLDAFLWTAQLGMVDLNSYLAATLAASGANQFGLDHLSSATGISADGTTIVGIDATSTGDIGWIATISVPEPSTGALLIVGLAIYALACNRHLPRRLLGNHLPHSIVVAFIVFASAHQPSIAAQYTVTDLGPGTSAHINNSGQVAFGQGDVRLYAPGVGVVSLAYQFEIIATAIKLAPFNVARAQNSLPSTDRL